MAPHNAEVQFTAAISRKSLQLYVYLTWCFTFAFFVGLRLLFFLIFFIVNHYMFQSDWPSSVLQVVVMMNPAVLLFCCNCLGQNSRFLKFSDLCT
jgi:hypothetical protein